MYVRLNLDHILNIKEKSKEGKKINFIPLFMIGELKKS